MSEVVLQKYFTYVSSTSNSNKFYLIQVKRDEEKGAWVLYTRWGRIGSRGQSSEMRFSSRWVALSKASDKGSEKIAKGYREVKLMSIYDPMEPVADGSDDFIDKTQIRWLNPEEVKSALNYLNKALKHYDDMYGKQNGLYNALRIIGYRTSDIQSFVRSVSRDDIMDWIAKLEEILPALEVLNELA